MHDILGCGNWKGISKKNSEIAFGVILYKN